MLEQDYRPQGWESTLGALVVGLGIYSDLKWVMNGGVVLAALGVVWIMIRNPKWLFTASLNAAGPAA